MNLAIALALVIAGASYVHLRWRRSPHAYRAMIALSAGYFIAGALLAAWLFRVPTPPPPAVEAPRAAVPAPESTVPMAPTLKENYTGPIHPLPPVHFDPVHAIRPDPKLTPGDTLPGVTAADVCTPGWAREHRDVNEEMRARVYAEYGRTEGPGCCEVDHLIPLELGGSNDIKNLWAQPDDPRPGDPEKDQLENDLHRRVCKGEMSLADAQKCIASDWVTCWMKYVVPGYGPAWAIANRHGW